jgi:hypothetical protein
MSWLNPFFFTKQTEEPQPRTSPTITAQTFFRHLFSNSNFYTKGPVSFLEHCIINQSYDDLSHHRILLDIMNEDAFTFQERMYKQWLIQSYAKYFFSFAKTTPPYLPNKNYTLLNSGTIGITEDKTIVEISKENKEGKSHYIEKKSPNSSCCFNRKSEVFYFIGDNHIYAHKNNKTYSIKSLQSFINTFWKTKCRHAKTYRLQAADDLYIIIECDCLFIIINMTTGKLVHSKQYSGHRIDQIISTATGLHVIVKVPVSDAHSYFSFFIKNGCNHAVRKFLPQNLQITKKQFQGFYNLNTKNHFFAITPEGSFLHSDCYKIDGTESREDTITHQLLDEKGNNLCTIKKLIPLTNQPYVIIGAATDHNSTRGKLLLYHIDSPKPLVTLQEKVYLTTVDYNPHLDALAYVTYNDSHGDDQLVIQKNKSSWLGKRLKNLIIMIGIEEYKSLYSQEDYEGFNITEKPQLADEWKQLIALYNEKEEGTV